MGDKILETVEWVPITGSDLLLCGPAMYQGKQIDKSKTYEIKCPVYIHSKFERELKKQFRKDGENGLLSVVKTEHDRRATKKR